MTIRYLTRGIVIAVLFSPGFALRVPGQSSKAERLELAKYVEAEKFVVEQLTAGYMADLEEKFKGRDEKRVIRASFLEALLLNPAGANIHRNGIAISGARIVGAVDLTNAEIDSLVYP